MSVIDHFIQKAKQSAYSGTGWERKRKVDGNTTIIMERIKRIEARDYQSVPSRGRRTRERDIIQLEPELQEDRFQKPNKGHECGR
eukprot:8435127-Ditylum_brightwellii.AAC.1